MWKAKATSKTQLLIFIYTEAVNISSFLLDYKLSPILTVKRQNCKKITANRPSYHPIETLF